MIKLNSSIVDLWFCDSSEINDSSLLTAYQSLLSPDERLKNNRIRLTRAKHQNLITRACIRDVLSQYDSIPPDKWRFSIGDYGKPEIHPDISIKPIRFNLSHTKDMIVCAITSDHAIGVDIERIDRKTNTQAISNRFFSSRECHDITSQPPDLQTRRFYQHWTLKEAYIKAIGTGLSLPLDEIGFDISDKTSIKAVLSETTQINLDNWFFESIAWEHAYQLGIAINASHPITLKTRKIIPLHSWENCASDRNPE